MLSLLQPVSSGGQAVLLLTLVYGAAKQSFLMKAYNFA